MNLITAEIMADPTTLYIKNMVCPRCIMTVRQIVEQLDISYTDIRLGEISVAHPLEHTVQVRLEKALEEVGFSLIDDRKSRLIEQLKKLVIQQVHHTSDSLNITWASFIADHFPYDYKYLSTLFSSVEGITLEQYIIRQKVERIKELIVYDELTLSQIAFQLGYSSVAHLSSQFKKITGITPSQFKHTVERKRNSLDNVS